MERKKGTLWTWDITATEPTVGTARESDPLTTQACMRPTSPAPHGGTRDPEDCAHQAGVGKSGKRERGIDGWRGTHGLDRRRDDCEETITQEVVCTTIYY